ncbi:hypothetical protein AMATHDRAFT_143293 [Amanita thiersii Skay4041]|uniref:AAA+ ATPase domain-containing protein n=1 Tax=Amanita thiersii Skay4041 TaxID=703135 RepID=A0A2A9NP74_9AGAR|nr:hypothetical protein AMATHDRAFT_143293 [Amanita thiersii Skay4041]
MNSNGTQLRRPIQRANSRHHLLSLHWLFRSNIPRRRNSFLPNEIHKRNFFGMGEVLSVLANPAETVRSLTESRRMLDEARQELTESRERAQLRPKHTFSRLPGFFPRKAEMKSIERVLEGEPSFTILFGASSVGKTALLREVLSREQFHVVHFDLRIAGFADLASLYMSLSQQMEQYFEEVATVEGFEDFRKEAWSFKHDRIKVERRTLSDEESMRNCSQTMSPTIRTSDVSRLMELFQSSLLKYREFQRDNNESDSRRPAMRLGRQNSDDTSDNTRVNSTPVLPEVRKKSRWNFYKKFALSKYKQRMKATPQQHPGEAEKHGTVKHEKKMPVIFIDEAHRLPSLIKSTETMKCLLESMLVLTKQDRLCHVIHATSDPFYQTWLRQLNVMQHCKILTIGDCSKSETRIYFRDHLLTRIPERIRPGLDFEQLFDAFGGKLAHWNDYITDYVNSNGTLDVKQSSHFLQAHSLLNLHIIHSSQSETSQQNGPPNASSSSHVNNPSLLHPNLGPAGFRTYSPSTHGASIAPGSTVDAGLAAVGLSDDRVTAMVAGYYSADFTAMQLLKVMSRLAGRSGRGSQSGTVQGPDEAPYLPYFLLCREMGVRAVDAMVRGRVLGLRWTEPITKEGVESRVRSGISVNPPGYREGNFAGQSSGTAVDLGVSVNAGIGVEDVDDEEIIAVPEHEMGGPFYDDEEELLEVVGPKLVPITPIMRYAMKEVVQEYEDDGSVSEYASVIDPDEY